MSFEQDYARGRDRLLKDKSICDENRKLFKEFLDYEEYKLKRIRKLKKLDESCYKSLRSYVSRFRTVNDWFKNKPWKELTEKNIKKVYDDLEDGKIKNNRGEKYETSTFYRLMIRSKPFEMAGQAENVRKAMPFYTAAEKNAVRFIKEETFRKIIEATRSHIHKCFLWLCWDIGENGFSLIQLRKSDFNRNINKQSKDPEYEVTLRKEILKRHRIPRMEITNYKETAQLLDIVLDQLKPDDLVFPFGHRMAEKILKVPGRKLKITCIPNKEEITLKDLRSSMACDLLSKGWTTDQVNERLGHAPSSKEIDKYVNWLNLNKTIPKKTFNDLSMGNLQAENDEIKQDLKFKEARIEHITKNNENLSKKIELLARAMTLTAEKQFVKMNIAKFKQLEEELKIINDQLRTLQ